MTLTPNSVVAGVEAHMAIVASSVSASQARRTLSASGERGRFASFGGRVNQL